MAENDNLPPMPASRGKNRDLWAGVFVLFGLVSVIVLLFALTDPALFRGRYVVKTVMDNASGIRRGDPVLLRGVNIGRVQSFQIVPEGVAISLEIEGTYRIPEGSKVELVSNSVLGGVVADVLPSESTTFVRGGATLPGSRGKGLFDTFGKLADQAEATLGNAQKTLSPETMQAIQAGSQELHQLIKELRVVTAEQRIELKGLSQSLKRSANGVEKAANLPELERAIKRADSLTARLDETSATLTRSSKSLETVIGRMERGEGTLGKLSKDEALYDNLNKSSASLKELIEDVRKQPKRYLKLSLF
jgi:phospholipid/cholesterol/gamma-HCH transport system substrate-binding protein